MLIRNIDDVLSLDCVKTALAQLKLLCGVTQADFIKLYENTLKRYLDFTLEPNVAFDTAKLNNELKQLIRSLRKRQQYLLPLNSDSEVSFREREIWSFAVFSASLMMNISRTHRLVISKVILGHTAFAWLYRNKHLFKQWSCFLKEERNTIFDKIVQQVGNIPIANEASTEELSSNLVQNNTSHKTNRTERIPKSITHQKPKTITEINLNDINQESNSNISQHIRATTKPDQQTSLNLKSKSCWQWLIKGISDKTISVNQLDSFVHHVIEGFLIELSGLVDGYIQYHIQELQIETDDASLLQQKYELMKKLKKHPDLIRYNGSLIHRYAVKDSDTNHHYSGVILPTNETSSINNIPINPNLKLVTNVLTKS